MSETIVLAQEQETNNFLIPNGTFLAELIIFVIVLAIIWRFIVPPIRKAMTERHDRVERQMEESARAKQRFAEADQRYREALSEARSESGKIRDEARAEGQRVIEELREQTNTEVAQIRQRGEDQLAEQRERVVSELRESVGELSLNLAGRVVGASLDEASSRAEAERFLSERARSAEGVQAGSGHTSVRGGA